MPNRLFLLLTLVLAATLVYGQKYFVFDIKGKVLADGMPLAVKSMLTADTELTFATADAEVHVVSRQGKQVIVPAGLILNERNELTGTIAHTILPPEKYRSSVTRANGTELQLRSLAELKAFFRHEVLVFDTTAYLVDAPDFPLDSTRYFELHYSGEDAPVSKRLPGREKQFYLESSKDISDSTGLVVELFYLDPEQAKPAGIGSFTLVTADREKLVETFRILHEIFPKAGPDFLFEEALPYLEMRYGKANPAQVRVLLSDELGLEF